MLKKRILISTLTLLFLVSTTGLPIWTHYCEMMNKRSNSECEMCKDEIEKVEPACCSEEIQNNKLQVSVDNSTCCVDQFDYKKIEDNFSQTLNPNKNLLFIAVATLSTATIDLNKSETHTQQNNYNLPPPKFGKLLLQTIHQLKIDLPVC
jgi:hypothetical protein